MKIPFDMVSGYVHNTNYGDVRIIKYNGALNVSVMFVDTGYLVTTRSDSIRNKQVKDKIKPSIFGVGFVGDGCFKTFLNRKRTVEYEKWYHMLERCYCPKYHSRFPTYKDCSVCELWHNFQNFAAWLTSQTEDIESTELDKDGIINGNRVYSPEACSLISKQENIEISQSCRYKVLSPNGVIVNVFNLNKFARENSLNAGNLRSVINGKRRHHKNWTKCND